jgi:predicted transcriptional regulator of viral defense system
MARNLSKQETSLVLELEWRGQRIVSRSEVIQTKNGNAKAADKLISSLRRKNWLERIGTGKYMLIRAERGPEGVAE